MSAILTPSHDEWQTPPALIAALRPEFLFTLDAAATAENTVVRGAGAWISAAEDALVTPWAGAVVWCNPPYSQIRRFVERAYDQSQAQQNTVVLLLPAYTDTAYWWDTVLKADEIRFLKGRLAFLEAGKRKSAARFPSALAIFQAHVGIRRASRHAWWWDWRA